MQQPNKLTPVVISSLIMIGISLFPFLNLINFLCCAGIMIASVIGTSYYVKQMLANGLEIQIKDGVMIGLLSGFFSAIVVVIATTIIGMISSQNPVPELYNLLDKQGFKVPPQAEEFLRKISDEYSRTGYSITMTIISFVVYVITYPLFGALGGMLAVMVYNRRKVR
jgi:hypothetical protein